MADPFYLGGPSKSDEPAAVLLDEQEVEAIPIFRCACLGLAPGACLCSFCANILVVWTERPLKMQSRPLFDSTIQRASVTAM
jgi:hypothetical protein